MQTNTDPIYVAIVDNTGNADTRYSHTDLTPDTVYAYRISSINSTCESDPSSSVTVKPLPVSIHKVRISRILMSLLM